VTVVKVERCSRAQDKAPKALRERDAIGVEGVSAPRPIRDSGERRELPVGFHGRVPVKMNLVHFICHRTHSVKRKFNIFTDNYQHF